MIYMAHLSEVFHYRLLQESKAKRDKWVGLLFSIAAHVALLIVGGIVFIKPIEFAVETGLSGMEVQLVAGVQEPLPAPVPAPEKTFEVKEEIVQPIKPEIIEPIPIKETKKEEIQEIKQEVKTLGNAPINAPAAQGALTEAKPDYLSNPAPRYPFEARRKGWHGTVILSVAVDKDGHPANIKVAESSKYRILDEAAIKTVKTWKFHPAKLGNLSVESSVRVPIRFRLEDERS